MQEPAAPDLLVDDSPGARRTGAVLATVAAAALLGNCLLNSPGQFSTAHQQDDSLLRPVVTLLALGARFPTTRGVEIRDLIFYGGAVILAFVAGLRLLSCGRRPRLAFDDLIDVRRRAAGPYFWWFLLLLVSAVSSAYAHAPDVCQGQSVIRFLHLAWWWPLAAMLTAGQARRLSGWLLGVLGATALLGIWYQLHRPQPRLQYPIGNELFLAACLLPGVFIAGGLIAGRLQAPRPDESAVAGPWIGRLKIVVVLLAAAAIVVALYLTRSRSAAVGLAAGIVTVLLFAAAKGTRRWVLLAAAALAVGAALWVQNLRVEGEAGQRAHSIRARLNHEWPYAIALFMQKPLTGWGDGAYAMLAGQFAREEQLDDPAILSFDEWSWVEHPHNEFLELLSDLGLAGMLSFAAALGMTLFYTVRYCDRLREDATGQANRWLVIGLAGAMVALVVEECSDVALRKPGLPPIFLTVWAMLWVFARSQRGGVQIETDESRRLGQSALRLFGTAGCITAVFMAMYAVEDWQAARIFYDARQNLTQGRYADAARQADFAGEHTLRPSAKLIARVHAIWARSLRFDQLLVGTDAPPTEMDLDVARRGMLLLEKLKDTAPRYLMAARLEADLALNLARAHMQRGETAQAREYRTRFEQALEQHRADEPFQFDVVASIWNARPNATAFDRLLWLRCLLRNGEIEEGLLHLLRDLDSRQDFRPTLGDLYGIAGQDADRPPEQWADRLSPETLRLAALTHAALMGQPIDAAKSAAQAEAMYAKAGPRLFAARAAAIHEMVRYRFDADPAAGTDENLALLARAQTILAAPADASTPIPEGLGYTRLRILLAAGREQPAAAQLELLQSGESGPPQSKMADAYRAIAEQFAERPEHAEFALRWSRRATELAPDSPHGYRALTWLYLRSGDDAAALEAAERFLRRAVDKNTAYQHLGLLEMRYARSTIWAELRRRHGGFPPPTTTNPVEAAKPPATNSAPTSDANPTRRRP